MASASLVETAWLWDGEWTVDAGGKKEEEERAKT